jgi:hypothetical protein
MVQYYWDIPVSAPVASLLGARVSDKTLVYLAGAHLLLSTHPASTLPGAAVRPHPLPPPPAPPPRPRAPRPAPCPA